MCATSLSQSSQGAVLAYTDITERKQAQEALRESELLYRTLFERATEGILHLADAGTITLANEAFARMHGYSVQEMQGMNLKELDTRATYSLHSDRIRRLQAGEVMTFEVEHYHKDGHIFPLEVSAARSPSVENLLFKAFIATSPSASGRKQRRPNRRS